MLSFVTLYLANKLEVIPEHLIEPVNISIPVGEPTFAERVYTDYTFPFIIEIPG